MPAQQPEQTAVCLLALPAPCSVTQLPAPISEAAEGSNGSARLLPALRVLSISKTPGQPSQHCRNCVLYQSKAQRIPPCPLHPTHATKHLPDPIHSLHVASVMLTAQSRHSAALPQAECPKPPAMELNASTSCRRFLSPAAPLPAFCMAFPAT